MSNGMFLYSKGNMCSADDLWEARHLIIDNLEDSEDLNRELFEFIKDILINGGPRDNAMDRFADHIIDKMKNEGYQWETHGGNVWRYVVKCDCEHCEHKGEGVDFMGYPVCKENSYSGDCKGVKYCEYMAEKERQ